jgi:hypothetical protein
MNERNKSRNPYDVKVIALGKACKPAKSLASFMGGDTTEFDSEVILQCKQRKLGYSIVKVGAIVEDDAPIPSSVRDRSITASSAKLAPAEEALALPLYQAPIVFTTSRVENSEVTRKSVAVEALLRSATYPHMNSTIAVLSAAGNGAANEVLDNDWDDEFLKVSASQYSNRQ